ncbi:MAG: transposase [Candidatus Xenobium sp.]|jgi:transposase-like protein|nr:transposase [Burkholderiales bacterium]
MEKGEKRPTYTKEFRERAVQLSVDSDQTLEVVAADLGVSLGTLSRWRRRQGVSTPRGAVQALRESRAENEELKKRNRQLEKEKKLAEMEREIFKRCGGLLREGTGRRFQFIQAEKDEFPVVLMCRCLEVSVSGYYEWAGREPS